MVDDSQTASSTPPEVEYYLDDGKIVCSSRGLQIYYTGLIGELSPAQALELAYDIRRLCGTQKQSADRYACDACWNAVNSELAYGLIPWRREHPVGERCASCNCDNLPDLAVVLPPQNFLETLGFCSAVVKTAER